MNVLDGMEQKKAERIKDLLTHPPEERTDKMLLEIMSFTRVKKNLYFKIFKGL